MPATALGHDRVKPHSSPRGVKRLSVSLTWPSDCLSVELGLSSSPGGTPLPSGPDPWNLALVHTPCQDPGETSTSRMAGNQGW